MKKILGNSQTVSYIPKSGDSKLETFRKMSKMADAKEVRLSVTFDGVKIIVFPVNQLESDIPIDTEKRGEYYYKLYRKRIGDRQEITRGLNSHYRSF